MRKFILLLIVAFIVSCAKPVKTVDTYENYLRDLSGYKVIQSSKVTIKWNKKNRSDEFEIAVLEGRDGNRYLKFDYFDDYISGGYILCNLTKFKKDVETTGHGSCTAIEGNNKGYVYFKMHYHAKGITLVSGTQKGYGGLSVKIGAGYYRSRYREDKYEILRFFYCAQL